MSRTIEIYVEYSNKGVSKHLLFKYRGSPIASRPLDYGRVEEMIDAWIDDGQIYDPTSDLANYPH